jgi:hypothetical protein
MYALTDESEKASSLRSGQNARLADLDPILITADDTTRARSQTRLSSVAADSSNSQASD